MVHSTSKHPQCCMETRAHGIISLIVGTRVRWQRLRIYCFARRLLSKLSVPCFNTSATDTLGSRESIILSYLACLRCELLRRRMMLNVVGRVRRLCGIGWPFFERAPSTASSSRCKPDHALTSSKRVNISKSFDAADCADAFLKPSGYSVLSVLLTVIMLIPVSKFR